MQSSCQRGNRPIASVGWSAECPLPYLAIHMYPEKDQLDTAIDTLTRCRKAGKPVLIEETYPLRCN